MDRATAHSVRPSWHSRNLGARERCTTTDPDPCGRGRASATPVGIDFAPQGPEACHDYSDRLVLGTTMAIIQALIAALTRSAGKLLNTAFSWATILLFGRVSQDRQIYVSAIAFGSVIWLVVLAGVAFPSFATFLLSFVALPKWIDKRWIRLAMLTAVVLLPALIGVVSILMLEREKRPHGAGAVTKAVLRGYPYTIGLALTLAMMTIFAPVLKIRTLIKRW